MSRIIIERMLEYINTREKALLLSNDIELDEKTLTVIVTNILSWIKLEKKREIWKSQGRKAKSKSLDLNMNYPWCENLCKLVEREELFNKFFCIKNSKFDFSETISEEEKDFIKDMVYENYNPQPHTYERP